MIYNAIAINWIRDLESGNFNQGHGKLRFEEPDGTRLDCCLGVLCDGLIRHGNSPIKLAWIAPSPRADERDRYYSIETEQDYEGSVLPYDLREALGMSAEQMNEFWRANDNEGKTFAQIANIVRAVTGLAPPIDSAMEDKLYDAGLSLHANGLLVKRYERTDSW